MPRKSSKNEGILKEEDKMLELSVTGLKKNELNKMVKSIKSETNIQIKDFFSFGKKEK